MSDEVNIAERKNDNAKKHRHLSPAAVGLLHRQPLPFLSEELIFQILLWLPIRFLLQLKCVCKSWKTLISDPQFAKTHLKNLTLNPPCITNKRLFSILTDEPCKIISFPIKPLLENPLEATNAVEFNMEHEFRILGSCNGLLCLFDMDQGYVKLWNPCINFESKKSPIIDCYDKRYYITYHGFGYDHVNDKYKVLVGFEENVTRLYTFGENSWKTIHNFPCRPTRWIGKFTSGTLNWVIVKSGVSSNQNAVLSFDIETETYKEVLLPEHDSLKVYYNPMLGVLNNCLYVCFDSNGTHMVLWLMKIYGVAESWTRLMMIPNEKVWYINHCVVDNLFILENGIVLVKEFFKFILYNFNNGRVDYPPLCSIQGLDQHIYHESLVSVPQW